MATRWARLFQFGLLLAFWGYSLRNLDRLPLVSEDEPWILSPGYHLFTNGIYGSELFAGYYGMEAHYLEFMPLMSVVLGATTKVLGIGIWQMRFAPVVLGTVLLALTMALATRLSQATVGALAGLLLVAWQWTREGGGQLVSGIPLADLARIARYDILVAALGLGALLMFVRAQQTHRRIFTLACAGLCGLAGLAHIYGVFWWVALSALARWGSVDTHSFYPDAMRDPVSSRNWVPGRHFVGWSNLIRLRPPPWNLTWLVGLPLVMWAAWSLVLFSHWSDFIGQLRLNVSCFAGEPCFNLGQGAFYWRNLTTEYYRYQLHTDAPLARWGGWLLILGIPAALVWLTGRVLVQRDRRAGWLLLPALALPLLLAVLIPRKLFNYLASVAPLWSIVLAWAGSQWFASARPAGRVALALGLIGVVAQGAGALAGAQRNLAAQAPLTPLFAELRQVLPSTGRILGPHVFWLALTERDYRSCGLPSFLSSPEVGPPVMSFAEALNFIAPRIVLLDGPNAGVLADTSTPYARERRQAWLSYLDVHRARVIREWWDSQGRLRLRVYVLDVAR